MALNGTLADLGIVDLIQFPNKGRRSGELVLAGPKEEARLYYVDGNLTHAVTGSLRGMDALVEIVSWTEGEFEFRTGVENDVKSVELDLHRALMTALKMRDERMEKLRKNKARPGPTVSDADKTALSIRELMDKNSDIQGICILFADGSVAAEAEADDVEKGRFAEVREAISTFYKQYNVGGLARTFFEDDSSVVHGARLSDGRLAVISANRETSMGQLSLMMNRLVTSVGGASV